jgi:hypothetical protein
VTRIAQIGAAPGAERPFLAGQARSRPCRILAHFTGMATIRRGSRRQARPPPALRRWRQMFTPRGSRESGNLLAETLRNSAAISALPNEPERSPSLDTSAAH